MNDFNQFACTGTVVADPESRAAGAATVAKLRLVINRDKKTPTGYERGEGIFIDVEAWDWLARSAMERLSKGTKVFVAGSILMDSWEDKQGGGKRSKLYVRADKFEVVALPDRGGGERPAGKPDADIPF